MALPNDNYLMRMNPFSSALFRKSWVSTWLVAIAVTAGADRVSLRLMEDRLWLEIDQAPIQEVMKAFTHVGVDVRLDPTIRANVDGTLEDVDIEEALQEILGPFSYVLQWRKIDGPSGSMILLDSMEVFQTGKRDLAQTLNKTSLEIIRPVDGPAYVKEELLLALNSKISPAEFQQLLARIGGTVIDSLHPPGIYRIRLEVNADVPSMTALLNSDEAVHSAEPNFVYDPIGTAGLQGTDQPPAFRLLPRPSQASRR